MKLFLPFIVTLLISTVLSVQIDYCWRDYNGDVPDDAVRAGVDKSGKPIYVGQGLFVRTGLLPGTLHPGSTNLTVTAVQQVFSTLKYVKILCTKRPYNFRWTRVDSYDDIALLTDVHLVEGGTESDSILHIGRVQHEGSTEVGKIYNVAPFQGLALPNRDQGETRYQSFDILTYSLNVIDVRYDNN